jgi:hypothetical protein
MNELGLRDKHDRERIETILRQAARIEALEAALREIVAAPTRFVYGQGMLEAMHAMTDIAKSALAPEQDR